MAYAGAPGGERETAPPRDAHLLCSKDRKTRLYLWIVDDRILELKPFPQGINFGLALRIRFVIDLRP